jgi:hypothetical protein
MWIVDAFLWGSGIKPMVYYLILRPMILRDYRLRENGVRADRFHWADEKAIEWGYFTIPAWYDRHEHSRISNAPS